MLCHKSFNDFEKKINLDIFNKKFEENNKHIENKYEYIDPPMNDDLYKNNNKIIYNTFPHEKSVINNINSFDYDFTKINFNDPLYIYNLMIFIIICIVVFLIIYIISSFL